MAHHKPNVDRTYKVSDETAEKILAELKRRVEEKKATAQAKKPEPEATDR